MTVEPSIQEHLPVYLTKFFGREEELAALERALADSSERVITLIGPGGVGKTRLAVEAVRRAASTLNADILYVDGMALEQSSFLLPEIADLLEIDRSSGQPVGELISEALAGRSLLLVLDNMEHLIPATVDIAALLRALPGLRVLATSRSSIRIAGERLIAVDPLETGSSNAQSEELSVAGLLFVDRAARAGNPIPNDARSRALVESICAQLDGLPLAVELAAVRSKMFPLPALLNALTRQLAILTGGPADVSTRHQNLRAAIAWSDSLLAADEQRLLRELGVFADAFTLEAAAAVCSPAEREIVELLESIYDQALLVRVEDDIDGQPRFRMLTSIRDYALEQLRASGDESSLRQRHADWFLELTESLVVNLHGEGQRQAVVRIDRMAPNIRQAFAWFLAQGEQEAALRMAVALQRYWRIRALWAEGRQAFAAAMALGEAQPTALWANAYRGAAICAELSFDSDAALESNQKAIAIWEALGDHNGMAMSLIDLGNSYNNLGRFDDAIAAFQKAGELTGAISTRTALVAQASMASALLRKGDLEASDRAHRQAAPLLRKIDDPSLLATFLSNQAVVRQRLGDIDEAEQILNECLGIQQALGDDYGRSVTLANLADLQRDPAAMERYAKDALQLAIRIDASDVIAAVSANLGDAALQRGDVAGAAERLIEALDRFALIGDELGQADVVGLIGGSAIESDPIAAVRLISAAKAVYTRNNVQPTSPQAVRALAIYDRLRDMLSANEFELAREVGEEWSLDEAVLEARDLARTERALTSVARAQVVEQGFGLTPRELDVLKLVAAGLSNREIADQLFISVRTANTHVQRMLAKLESRNRASAVALAYQHGLVQLS